MAPAEEEPLEQHTRALRLFVAVDWLLVVPSLAAASAVDASLLEEACDGNLQFFVWIDELGLVALVAWLVASIGAFRLWRPARALYLVAVALCVAASSTTETEPAITPAVLDAIAQLGCVTSGLVLGLLSEARQHFRRERP